MIIFILVLIPLVLFSVKIYRSNMSSKTTVNNPTKEVKAASTKNQEIPAASPNPTVIPTPINHYIYLGMWTQGFFDPASGTLHPEALHTLENTIGKKVAIAHYYRGWDSLDSTVFLNELNTISENGWRPMISANPYFFDRCKANGLTLYKTIANGACDDFLHSVGKNFQKFGKLVFFRFAWEMNTDSMEWAISKTGNSSADFISAWQRIHAIFYQEDASNVLFVFSPNAGGNVSYKDIYPGDVFVDWVALDGYNWGTTQTWSKWESFSSVFRSSYYQLISVAPNKPVMIAETNTTDQGGDKAKWYQDTFSQILYNFPKIKAVVVYNENREAKEHVNWLIDAVPDSLRAFSKAIGSSNYLSSF